MFSKIKRQAKLEAPPFKNNEPETLYGTAVSLTRDMLPPQPLHKQALRLLISGSPKKSEEDSTQSFSFEAEDSESSNSDFSRKPHGNYQHTETSVWSFSVASRAAVRDQSIQKASPHELAAPNQSIICETHTPPSFLK